MRRTRTHGVLGIGVVVAVVVLVACESGAPAQQRILEQTSFGTGARQVAQRTVREGELSTYFIVDVPELSAPPKVTPPFGFREQPFFADSVGGFTPYASFAGPDPTDPNHGCRITASRRDGDADSFELSVRPNHPGVVHQWDADHQSGVLVQVIC